MLVGSASLVAIRTTLSGWGGACGARNSTVVSEPDGVAHGFEPTAHTSPKAEFPFVTPFTDHVTFAFDVPVTVAVKLAVCPAGTAADAGDTFTAIGALLARVTVADALCVSAAALMVTGFVVGVVVGAVYVALFAPVGVTVPNVELPPSIPSTSHVIAVPDATHRVAVKLCVAPSVRITELGNTEFVAPHEIVTLATALSDESATLVAITETDAAAGGTAGAVYVAASGPVTLSVPTVAFPPLMPFTLHVTAELPVPTPLTVAVKFAVPPGTMLAEAGTMLTTMPLWICTVADPLACGSACVVAVTVTIETEGVISGAV